VDRAQLWRAGEPGDRVAAVSQTGLLLQKKSLIAAEQRAEERAEERAAWRERTARVDPTRFVFLDETGTPTTLTPLRGWAPRSHRLVGRVPRRRWHRVTLLSALTVAGMGASVVIDGAVDRRMFDAFVEQELVPTLVPGQSVVLANLSVHRSAAARMAIEAAGCALWFLPTYSPDLNPIEAAFAKIKQLLRRTAARSYEALVAATKPALDAVTARDVAGFFRHAGYLPPQNTGQLL
jgi:transposase